MANLFLRLSLLLAMTAVAVVHAGVVRSGVPLSVVVELGERWKLNDKVSSRLSVFRVGEGRLPVVRSPVVALAGGTAPLPPLAPGGYRLQGRIYYCGKNALSVCVMQKVDQFFEVRPEAAPTVIPIPIGPSGVPAN